MYDLGDTVRLAATVRDAGGTASDAAAVVLTITLPDGTTVTPTVTNPPAVTGQYTVDYVTTQAGRHAWRLVATTPSDAYGDVFNVREAGSRAIVGLADVKDHLNIAQATTAHDSELRRAIETVTDVIEYYVGTVVRRTVVETHSGRGQASLVLREWPAASITSVTESGTAVDAAGYSLDEDGLLTRVSGYSDLAWRAGRNNIVVTYQVGLTIVRPSILEAAKELIRVNFAPQLGGSYNPFNRSAAADTGPGERRLGFFVPNRVVELLVPNQQPPGIA